MNHLLWSWDPRRRAFLSSPRSVRVIQAPDRCSPNALALDEPSLAGCARMSLARTVLTTLQLGSTPRARPAPAGDVAYLEQHRCSVDAGGLCLRSSVHLLEVLNGLGWPAGTPVCSENPDKAPALARR